MSIRALPRRPPRTTGAAVSLGTVGRTARNNHRREPQAQRNRYRNHQPLHRRPTRARQPVTLPVVMVSVIERNIFSVPSTTREGATNVFALEESRIETNDVTIPLHQLGGRRDVYTFNSDLGGVRLALDAEENVNQRHNRGANMNHRGWSFSVPEVSWPSKTPPRSWRTGIGRAGSAGTARTSRHTASTLRQHTRWWSAGTSCSSRRHRRWRLHR